MARLVIHAKSDDLDQLPARLREYAALVEQLVTCKSRREVQRLVNARLALCSFCQSVKGNPAVDEEFACRQCGPLPVVEGLVSLRLLLAEGRGDA